MKEKLESTYWTRLMERVGWLLALASLSGIVFIIDELYPLFRWGLSYRSIESFKRSWLDHVVLDERTIMIFGAFFLALVALPLSVKLVIKYRKTNKAAAVEKKVQTESQRTAPRYMKILKNATLLGTGTQKLKNSGVDYNYLEFKGEDGQVVMMDGGAHVDNKMNINFSVGIKGNFYFADDGTGMALVGSEMNGEKRSIKIMSSFMLWFLGVMSYGAPTGNLIMNCFAHVISLCMFLWAPVLKALFCSRRSKRIKSYMLSQGFVA